MKVLIVATATICLGAGALPASQVLAGERVVATLQSPVREPSKVIAGDAVFLCAEDSCAAETPMSQTFSMATCKVLAAKFGTVLAFTGRIAFEPPRLAKCNGSATPRTAVAGVVQP